LWDAAQQTGYRGNIGSMANALCSARKVGPNPPVGYVSYAECHL